MSSLTTLARPYAKAAFQLAKEQDALSRWDGLLGLAAQIVSSEPMENLLGNPLVEKAKVVGIVTGALGEAADERFDDFITVLGQNKRLGLLPAISELFRELREEAEQRLSVRVVSAIPLEPDQRQRLQRALASRFERDIEMESVVDGSVLGGAVIYAGDQVIDGSLRGRLHKLQTSLSR